ncbi:MAG TPA: cytochrome c oxidase assembly factor Coa1 family protein [Thermoanaerobaculia bacterium]|nr:cytochrome c oxidase assembly factor Coa1 family protein [Thermoanaerobaculia bacterium]
MTIDYTRSPQPGPRVTRGGWWSRNWKWVVPVGCLTPIILIGGCVAAIAFVAISAIRATDLYTDSVRRAQADPRVIEQLGAPVEAGWWVMGSVKIENDRGSAQFTVPLHGTRKKGSLDVEGSRDGGEWTYSVIRVRVEDGPVIDLIPSLDPSIGEPADTTAPAG